MLEDFLKVGRDVLKEPVSPLGLNDLGVIINILEMILFWSGISWWFPEFYHSKKLAENSKKGIKIPSSFQNKKLRNFCVKKTKRIVEAGCIALGYVHWEIKFFGVPKGDEDIRLVYDGTISGINLFVWDPTFSLKALCLSLYCSLLTLTKWTLT